MPRVYQETTNNSAQYTDNPRRPRNSKDEGPDPARLEGAIALGLVTDVERYRSWVMENRTWKGKPLDVMSYEEQHNADQTVTITWWCRGLIEERHAPMGSRPMECKVPPWVEEPAKPERPHIKRPTREDRARRQREYDEREYNDAITRGELDPESVSFGQWRKQEFRRALTEVLEAQDKDDEDER